MKLATLILIHLIVFTGLVQAGPPKLITIRLHDYEGQLVGIKALTPQAEMNDLTPTQVMMALAPDSKNKKEMRGYSEISIYRYQLKFGFISISKEQLGIWPKEAHVRDLQSGDVVVLGREAF